ncbi:selenocysteine-specific elongation factor selB homologue, putative [Plasmodium malariae]|uniref:Selenocysteine-specific elongation factor selB homologue, putative n=1 Tax=Plasmodium malariae TaxID=5858 RepID=A0A1A8VS19_PLAMA|nr:selenocysteine-specific elongation factor selB homologue, putative [Plasmodium malariae]SBS81607.1 selenocysteine-specific elongation factor selB homologue, putative [Plasmodium malariae]SBT87093.1 selenocysteine-specific elongation factor selB homologue, putative [Plasmodium malariae]
MINVNVGVLGHVDSGKTSLCKCLSETLSTCALDKHKQSQERGITIDLGFSSFYIKKKKCKLFRKGGEESNKRNDEWNDVRSDERNDACIDHGKGDGSALTDLGTNKQMIISGENGLRNNFIASSKNERDEETIQVCLVDCPGHHSLLKCIVMGAEITDIIFLVIDINKGIQKQTIECLVLCEIVRSDIIIILNKIDLIPINEREKKIKLMKKKIEDALSKTRLRHLKYYIISLSAYIKRDDNMNDGCVERGLCNRGKEGIEEQEDEERKEVELYVDEYKTNNYKRENYICASDEKDDEINCSPRKGKRTHLVSKNDENTGPKKYEQKHEQKCKKTYEQNYAHTYEQNSTRRKEERKSCFANVDALIDLLSSIVRIPVKTKCTYEEFYFLFDHSFDIKGKGTAYTGTVIRGRIRNNCNIVILPINEKGKIKEIQTFKKKVEEGTKGDRLSLLISNNNLKNTKKIERGIIVFEKSNISYFSIFICKVKFVEFYKKNMNNAELLTCIIGFSSSPCYGYFFKKMVNQNGTAPNAEANAKVNVAISGTSNVTVNSTSQSEEWGHKPFDRNGHYVLVDKINFFTPQRDRESEGSEHGKGKDKSERSEHGKDESEEEEVYFLTVMKTKIYCYTNEKCIFLKNDDKLNCRICMYGHIIDMIDDDRHHKKSPFIVNKKPALNEYEGFENMKIMNAKEKIGLIEKVFDNFTLLCKNIFTSSSQITQYLDKKIYIVNSSYQNNKNEFKIEYIGRITKPFAKNGKFFAQFDEDISHIEKNCKSFIVLIKYYKDILTKRKIFL